MSENLPQRLTNILPDVLPATPEGRVFGGKLTKLLKEKDPSLSNYTDSSIRQTLSKLSGVPNSPIARYDQGFGYYARKLDPDGELEPEAHESADDQESDGSPRDQQREEKFRSLYIRYLKTELGVLAAKIDHTRSIHGVKGLNRWKFPDVISIEWLVDQDGESLDNELMEVRRGLGEASFKVSSIELKVSVSSSTLREAFFQCLSNSRWANHAILAIAAPIDDAQLANELRRLGTSYGIQVVSFGLQPDAIDSMPNAQNISEMSDAQFEKLTKKGFAEKVLVTGEEQAQLDWGHLSDVSTQNSDVRNVLRWIGLCLRNRKSYDYERALTIIGNE